MSHRVLHALLYLLYLLDLKIYRLHDDFQQVIRAPPYRSGWRMRVAYPPVLIGAHIVMNILVWLVVGGLLGWAASAVMRTQESILLNVAVGIIGAALGGWLLSPVIGVSTINQSNFSLPSLLVSFLGAVMLLVLVNFIRRGTRA